MPSTANKGLEIQTTGSNTGTWGQVLNDQALEYLDDYLGSITTKALTSSTNVTLTAEESRSVMLRLTSSGSITGSIVITTSCIGFVFVEALFTGTATVTIRNASIATAATLTSGTRAVIISDATNGCRLVAQSPPTLGTMATQDASAVAITGGTIDSVTLTNLDAPLALASGGTGVALADPGADRIVFWDDSDGFLDFLEVSTNLDLTGNVLTADAYPLTSANAQTSTSGTEIDFTAIPSWVKRITVLLNGVSISSSDELLIRIGDSGGFSATGYFSSLFSSAGSSTSTVGFLLTNSNAAANAWSGEIVLSNISSNNWVCSSICASTANSPRTSVGNKSLSATLDRVRLTTTGSGTFDAGTVNIMYE